MDKAGAYALQGEAARFVTAVDGDRETVIGLPTRLLRRLLERLRAGSAGYLE
jgi:septum formation protein